MLQDTQPVRLQFEGDLSIVVLCSEEAIAKAMFERMGCHITILDAKIDALEKLVLEQHKADVAR